MLAVVEDEQQRERLELGEEGVDDGAAAKGPQIKRVGERTRDESPIVENVELDEQHAVAVGVAATARELEGEPCLPDTACARKCQEPRAREHGRELGELVLAAHERRGLDR